MALVLRKDTAVDVLIGPFVDSTDGVTAETALTISQADVLLSKNGQALTQKNDATAAAHDANGYYNCELDATDTNTVGTLVLTVNESGALPVRHEFQVIEEAAYDAIYAASAPGPLPADDDGSGLTEAGGDGDHLTEAGGTGDHLTAINLPDQTMNITGNITGNLSGSVGSVTGAVGSVTGNVGGTVNGLTAAAQGNVRTAVGLATANLDTQLSAIDNFLDTEVAAILEDTGTTIPALIAALNDLSQADIRTAVGLASANLDTQLAALPTAAENADAVWDESTTGHTTAGTFGEQVKTDIDAILVDTGTTLDGKLDTIDGNVDAILVDTGTTLDGKLDTIDTVVDAILADTGTDGVIVASLGTQAKADVNAEVLDVLNTDTFGEPTGVPGATVSLVTKIGYLYMALRNKLTVTSSKKTFYDDGGAAEWEKDLSDDGTTYTESKGNAI